VNQKEEEKLVMEYFREAWNGFPKGKLVPSESPDFILKLNPKKSFGIELTRLPELESPFDALIMALKKKEQKIYLYKGQGFIKIWLIIYTDDLVKTSPYNFSNKIRNFEFQSSFDAVFLFDLFAKKEYLIK